MRKSLLQLDQFRFYSSSLLIIYEGRQFSDFSDIEEPRSFESEDSMDCDSFIPQIRSKKKSLAKIRIIDFANATMPGVFEDDRVHEGPDAGFLLGLKNLQEILESLVDYELKAREP